MEWEGSFHVSYVVGMRGEMHLHGKTRTDDFAEVPSRASFPFGITCNCRVGMNVVFAYSRTV